MVDSVESLGDVKEDDSYTGQLIELPITRRPHMRGSTVIIAGDHRAHI